MNFDDLHTLFAAGGLSLFVCLTLWSTGANRDGAGRARSPVRIDDAPHARRENARD